eukprot:GHVN01063512.1.p1 GENE.GHVN01063512.1~~GHVN01063512.1.p1  ORF type:complete len:102 (+),score=12.93 GHVN01063512.1:307-612(+)
MPRTGLSTSTLKHHEGNKLAAVLCSVCVDALVLSSLISFNIFRCPFVIAHLDDVDAGLMMTPLKLHQKIGVPAKQSLGSTGRDANPREFVISNSSVQTNII